MNKSDVVAVEPVIALAKAAGEVILEVYEKEYEIILEKLEAGFCRLRESCRRKLEESR